MSDEKTGIGTKLFIVVLYSPLAVCIWLEVGRAKGWW